MRAVQVKRLCARKSVQQAHHIPPSCAQGLLQSLKFWQADVSERGYERGRRGAGGEGRSCVVPHGVPSYRPYVGLNDNHALKPIL